MMTLNSFLSDPNSYIRLYIVFTLIWVAIFYVNKNENKYLFSIVLLSIACEIVTAVFKNQPRINHGNINIYFILNSILWFLILYELGHNKKRVIWTIVGYLIFSVVNLEFIEKGLNFNLLIVGSLLYLILFVIESFVQLNDENLSFFQSNKYLLLFCPVMFFLGLNFILAFKSTSISSTKIFWDITLYQLINYPVNIIYYTLINLYMFTEKRNANV
jgi:hypothetical protein